MAPVYKEFINDFSDLGLTSADLKMFLIIYIAVIATILLLFVLPHYIMLSISYTCIGRRNGVKAPWLAWIPVARYWTIGAIVDKYDERILGLKRRFRIVLLVFAAVYILSIISFISGILALIPMIINAIQGNSAEVFGNIMTLAFGLEYGISGLTYSSLILTALHYVCLYKIFEQLSPNNAILFLALSIAIPFFMPICLLVIRKKGYCVPDKQPEEIPEAVRIGWYEG